MSGVLTHRRAVAEGVGVLVLVAVIAFLIGRKVSNTPRMRSTTVGRVATEQPKLVPPADLFRALQLAERFVTPGGYPFAVSLASALEASDPATAYHALGSPAQVPPPGYVGVFSSQHSVWMIARASGRAEQVVRLVRRGSREVLFGPFLTSFSELADGRFDSPLIETWTVNSSKVAKVARDARIHLASPDSLRVDGTGVGGPPATATQTLAIASGIGRGGVFRTELVGRSFKLSRRLAVELKLTYTDGSYSFFQAASKNGTVGIPPGTSKDWVPLRIEAVALKPVKSAVLFAVDTGTAPLTGTAWIDDIVANR